MSAQADTRAGFFAGALWAIPPVAAGVLLVALYTHGLVDAPVAAFAATLAVLAVCALSVFARGRVLRWFDEETEFSGTLESLRLASYLRFSKNE